MAIQPSGDACASSSSSNSWTYDVFLSFRGEDTRCNFTDHLYNHLDKKGIRTFRDDVGLPRGEEISQALLDAIEGSRCSIIVFSQDYASSKWCLNELAHIIQCRESKKQMVWPVFYKVHPSEVRYQSGSYGEALANHERKFHEEAVATRDGNLKKLQRWKKALTASATLAGSHYRNEPEYKFIQKIVEEISRSLHIRTSLHVAKHPVGIESRVGDVEELLDVGGMHEVRMVGIWGTGGIGKTTIAKAVYNSIAHKFEGSCFLANVRQESMQRDAGLPKLQSRLLSNMLGGKEMEVTNVDEGINEIKYRLRHKRVLLILDDVNHWNQLDNLAGGGLDDWFGSGSRVIITTRDKQLLTARQVAPIYEVEKLDHSQASDLFISYAFKGDRRSLDDNAKLKINTVLDYAQGLPLALTVLGSLLCGKSVEKWDVILDSQRREPNEDIKKVLEISYDALRPVEQEVFLDIACFFKGKKKDYVMQIPNYSVAIDVLIEKALIVNGERDYIWMHDLLEDIGKELVHRESRDAGERSRLWRLEDVEHVLTENTGTKKIEGIIVNIPNSDEFRTFSVTAQSFLDMKNLRIFMNCHGVAQFSGDIDQLVLPNTLVLLDWPNYPYQSLPSNFYPKNLAVLEMPDSCITRLWEGFKCFKNLTSMNLDSCESLTKTPDFSGLPNLVKLRLICCTSLVEVDDSIRSLTKLATLNLFGCSNLSIFPTKVYWKSIKKLVFSYCGKLESCPEFQEKNESLLILVLSDSGIKELPPSIANLTVLQWLSLKGCENLTTLPRSLYSLQHVKWIFLCRCSKLVTLPQDKDDDTLALPRLRYLSLHRCSNLSDIKFLETLDCKSTLKALRLDKSNIVILPACIRQFVQLQFLGLWRCEKLQEIPTLPKRIWWVDASDCVSLERFSNLSDFFEGGNSQMNEYIDVSGCKCTRLNRYLEFSMAEKNNILRSLSFQRSHFKVILPGDEVPKWFGYRKSFREELGQEFECSFALPPKSELESCGLALCVSVKRNEQYFMHFRRRDIRFTILINEVSINDIDEDDSVAYALAIKGYFITGENLFLSYVPLRRYMHHPSVQSSGNNTCRVLLVLNTYWCIKSCGVHLVTPQNESACDEELLEDDDFSEEVKDVDASDEELSEDDVLSDLIHTYSPEDPEKAMFFAEQRDYSVCPGFTRNQNWTRVLQKKKKKTVRFGGM